MGGLFGKKAALPAQAPTPEQAPAPAQEATASTIPLSQVSLEQMAELNCRSARILMGIAKGSREQAWAWDTWLESYRGLRDKIEEALLAPGRKIEADFGALVGKAFWTELSSGPYRFAATHSMVSCYFIPWDAQPVPAITDYSPPGS